MTKKGIFVILLIIALMFLIATANALPRIFPAINFQNGGSNGMFDSYSNLLKQPGPYISVLSDKSNNYILICRAPNGYDWSDFDKGDSHCTMPTGPVTAGDCITDCEGVVTIIHKSSNDITISATFISSPSKDNDKEKQDDDPNDDQNDKEDTTEFSIKITKPLEKKSYLRNIQIKDSDKTIVVGQIDIETSIEKPQNIEISKVKFLIDDELKFEDKDSPYTWTWDEKIFGGHTIKVNAYDKNGNCLGEDEITVTILNFDIL